MQSFTSDSIEGPEVNFNLAWNQSLIRIENETNFIIAQNHQNFESNSMMELEAEFNFAQNYQFKSNSMMELGFDFSLAQNQDFRFENKAFELPLDICEHQIISSEDVLSEDESNKGLLRLYIGLIFTAWEDEYLTLHVLSLQCQQLSESFLYDATEISYNWDNFLLEPEDILENSCLEDDYERCQTGLRSLLYSLQYDEVDQIWIVTLQRSFPENNDDNNRVESEPIIEPQPVVTNPFVTKHCERTPKRLKDVLENITNTCHNLHDSNNRILVKNYVQEKKKNKYTNCGNYGHNVRTCDAN
ncbi:13898_t:CDS:2 [Dentiscutata heterogama]|uniref:13898_t:CDS:1 n=1 Tax=Dentiscutata heterogama TaxID=1316150 RepID=A0ACA9L9A8_9GLOM|nr:13898_t:CDS:2 [Dentiscutata heterogama]